MKKHYLQNRKQEISTKVDEDENGDVWICNECEEEWGDEDKNRWILSDICDAKFQI